MAGVLKARTAVNPDVWVSIGGGVVGGTGGTNYTFNQATPLATWNVTHNLGYYPSVTVVDSSGDVVDGDVHYNNANSVTITFSAAFAGAAYFS